MKRKLGSLLSVLLIAALLMSGLTSLAELEEIPLEAAQTNAAGRAADDELGFDESSGVEELAFGESSEGIDLNDSGEEISLLDALGQPQADEVLLLGEGAEANAEERVWQTRTAAFSANGIRGGMSNDELFEGYLLRTLPGLCGDVANDSPWAGRESLVDRGLTGSVAIYDAMKPLIIDVADGRRTSTEFKFSPGDIGMSDHWWSLEELGVDSFGDDNLFVALLEKEGIDIFRILTAIIDDFPYHLYWFDKTKGINTSAYLSNRGSDEVQLAEITLSLNVAKAYAADEYVVNTLPQRVHTAVENIEGIIDDNASLGDLDKLTAYANKICALVEYNHPAAEDDSTPYGDPWQLVYIFDGDPDTKVVCEGYAKGFKYLCDLSSFDRDVKCQTVVGILSQRGSPLGAHMWNSLRMPDGKCYLVDLTNCDAGDSCDGSLFLKGCQGTAPGPYTIDDVGYEFDKSEVIDQYGSDSPWLDYSNTDYSEEDQPEPHRDDPEGTLLATMTASGKRTLKLKWTMLTNVDGYDVFLAAPDEGYEVAASVKAGKSRSATLSGLKKKKLYRAYVRAWIESGSKKLYVGEASPEVYAYTGGGSGSWTNPDSVKVSPSKLKLSEGTSQKLKVTVKGVSSGKKVLKKGGLARYVSSDESVATVSKSGVVSAVDIGSCTVYAIASNGVYKAVKVTIVKAPTRVRFKERQYSVKKGKKLDLSKQVNLKPKSSTTIYTWKSSDKRIATVKDGVVKGRRRGVVTITVTTANGLSDKTKVRVY